MNTRWTSALLGLMLCTLGTNAAAQLFTGHFDNPANAALVGSDLGAAGFADDVSIANNVALYDLAVTTAGAVTITGTGFSAGGADPYVSLFNGAGSSAKFAASNYDQAFSSGGDFSFSVVLAAGLYQLAIGTFANLSFAENFGSGTLADGFTGLGSPGSLGDAGYRVAVSTAVTAAVPEASHWAMLMAGLFVIGARLRRRPN